MSRNLVYFYPSAPRGGYGNPYCSNFKENLCRQGFECLEPSYFFASYPLLIGSLKADLLVLNWIESVVFLKFGMVQFVITIIALLIAKIRKVRIIWVFHNISPHQGTNIASRFIQSILRRYADLIICHSSLAKNELSSKSCSGKILFKPHPISSPFIQTEEKAHYDKNIDLLIWGAILPYKGVVEFLSAPEILGCNANIVVAGKCHNIKLQEQICSLCRENVKFINERLPFSEIENLIRKSKYVLFPYLKESVSSSGCLMDSLVLHANIIGPQFGAFYDLENEDLCFTYKSYSDILNILEKNETKQDYLMDLYISKNTWSLFVHDVISNVK